MADNLFQSLAVSNKPTRNGFDIGNKVNFTAKAGEILPIWHRDCIFGDEFRLSINHFTRTAPVDTAAATQIREYFDVFFVPYRILWKNAPQVHTQNTANPVVATSPTGNLPVGSSTPHFDYTLGYLGANGSVSVSRTVLGRLVSKANAFGYDRAVMSAKLMNHLGFPYISSARLKKLNSVGNYNDPSVFGGFYSGPRYLSLYPLLAYQCIYYNFYRNTQWEENQPYNYNVDYLGNSTVVDFMSVAGSYWDNPTIFDLQYSNYPKDLFFGILPDSQDGDPSSVEVDINSPSDTPFSFPLKSANGQSLNLTANPPTNSGLISSTNTPLTSGAVHTDVSPGALSDRLSGQFDILQFRKAQFLQKYREIRGSGQQDYKNLVKRLFDVDVPDTLSYQPYYLGGVSSTIKISEVENTNLIGDNQTLIKGKGTGSSTSDTIEFKCQEPGLIMVLYHAQPVIDYALTALHFDLTKTEADDFANPIFDRLGYQELPTYYLDSSLETPNPDDDVHPYSFLGYTSRYFDYKTGVDMTLGDFRETSTTWLAPVNFDYLSDYVVNGQLMINANFFKVNPAILDPIFQLHAGFDIPSDELPSLDQEANYVTTDQLRVFSTINCSSIRPLDRNGLPY
ncbi:major capsid protein [Microvirus mar64]|uniref:Major capsid protein n=1 Tax=Microvirus mar64 TaxID=2851201 RepID=A0A8F5MJ93_9VIRU|nr:major capsid protein [Microvirus mar64]